MKNIHQAIYELLRSENRGTLLDAASGKGELGAALEENGFRVFSIDRYEHPDHGKRFAIADLNNFLPYKDEQFDFIICSESLQYLETHERPFSEFNRVLKKGGTLLISLPNILTVASRLFFLRRGYSPYFKPFRTKAQNKKWDNFIYNPISFVEVFQIIKKNGLKIKTVSATDFKMKGLWLYPPIKIFYLLGLIFEKDKKKAELIKIMSSKELMLGNHIIVCSVKPVE